MSISRASESETDDERTQLLERSSHQKPHATSPTRWAQNVILLLGVFLVNADNAIVLANFRRIASDFDRLQSASWIINSYVLGVICIQPLYGKLSDLYGRKPILVIAYACQCAGSLLAGIGFSFEGVLAGRAISGIGNAGITVLVSTLIVDIVPKQDVAVWRSYVYAVNQVGRALGPSLGGVISDRLNWRWALLYPFPLLILSMAVIIWTMSLPGPLQTKADIENDESKGRSKLRRIDFLGCGTLALANCSLLLFLDQLQTGSSIRLTVISSTFMATWLIFLAAFIFVEAFWVREPILPLRLLVTRNVFSSYAVQFLQTSAQVALYSSIPLYFSITRNEDSTTTSLRLLIISAGTIIGGLISGFVIKRTNRYRLLTIVSLFLSNASYLAIYLRWRGQTNWIEMVYAFLIGVGFGVSLSATFIALTANLRPNEVAVSTSGFYLSLNLGSLIGISGSSLIITGSTRASLRRSLGKDSNAAAIIRDVLSSLDSIRRLHGKTLQLVLKAYLKSIIYTWLFALVCGCLALIASFIMTEGKASDLEVENAANSTAGHIDDSD